MKLSLVFMIGGSSFGGSVFTSGIAMNTKKRCRWSSEFETPSTVSNVVTCKGDLLCNTDKADYVRLYNPSSLFLIR